MTWKYCLGLYWQPLIQYPDQIAGMVGKIIEYPFDTVKVRLQSQPSTLPLLYTGPIDCFRQSLYNGGINSLYRGVSAPLFGAAVENSSLFFSYRIAQKLYQAWFRPASLAPLTLGNADPELCLPFSAVVVCGGASGAFTSLLLTPIELVKCQMQVPVGRGPVTRRGATILEVIVSVFRHNGVLGFWHGQLGTLIREPGGSAAWCGSYEGGSALFRQHQPPPLLSPLAPDRTGSPSGSVTAGRPPLPIWQQLVSGAMAGVGYNFLFYPADTIKSRMQTEEIPRERLSLQSAASIKQRTTFWTTGRELWQQHGVKGLYRGCGITVARSAPSSAFIFTIYEALRSAFE